MDLSWEFPFDFSRNTFIGPCLPGLANKIARVSVFVCGFLLRLLWFLFALVVRLVYILFVVDFVG